MSISEWQEKFSSIVKQTETNLDRVKERLSSAKRTHTISGDILSNFTVPEHMAYSPSGQMLHGLSDTTLAVRCPIAAESPVSSTRTLPYVSAAGITDEARYIPLHQSSAVMTFLHDKIDEQTKTIEDLMRSVRKTEEEKESFQRDLHDVKSEIHRLHSGSAGREMDFTMEQKLDKLRQETMAEFKLMNQKYNYLKNQHEETAVAMETKNSCVTGTIIDLQKYVRGEIESVRREVASLEKRMRTIEGELSRMILTGPKSSATADQNIFARDPWQMTGQMTGYGGKNSVSFLHDVDRLKSGEGPNDLIQIRELKNSLKEVQRKLNSLEADVLPESKGALSDFRKTKQKSKSNLTKTLLSPSTSDLDVSTATDLVSFSYNITGKSNGSQSFDPNFTVTSDLSSGEDLTLDDL